MKIKKIILVALVLNIAISLIPIPHKTFMGTECPGYCYGYMPSHGFPLPFLTSNGLNSPIGAIDWEIFYSPIGILLVLIIFLINWLIIAAVVTVIDLIYKKIRKTGPVK